MQGNDDVTITCGLYLLPPGNTVNGSIYTRCIVTCTYIHSIDLPAPAMEKSALTPASGSGVEPLVQVLRRFPGVFSKEPIPAEWGRSCTSMMELPALVPSHV